VVDVLAREAVEVIDREACERGARAAAFSVGGTGEIASRSPNWMSTGAWMWVARRTGIVRDELDFLRRHLLAAETPAR
jgi:hypothetical protein